ncbi:MAG: hypothetical protein ACRDP6_02525 [Actinoallomurus sp.]
MSDHLDRDTVERMLRGEDTGPPNVAELLTAMSARPVRKDRRGEERAVAAFREARRTLDVPATAPAPAPRRLLVSRVLAVKAALAGILLMLAGGVAVAASPHLPQPHGTKHTPATHTPSTSQSAAKRLTTAPSPAPSSPYPTKDRAHHHQKARHPSERPSPHGSRKSHPSSKGQSKDKWGQPIPDLPLPVSRPPVCDALCDLDG